MFSVEFSTYPFVIWSCAFLLYLLRVKTREPQAGSFSKKIQPKTHKHKNKQSKIQQKKNFIATTERKTHTEARNQNENKSTNTHSKIYINRKGFLAFDVCLSFCHTDKLYESSRRKPGWRFTAGCEFWTMWKFCTNESIVWGAQQLRKHHS